MPMRSPPLLQDTNLRCTMSPVKAVEGFTYLGVLLAIALLSLSLAMVGEIWSKTAERQKMAQLDWVMEQYVKGIESYYYANTGSVRYYPPELQALLQDERHLGVVRHIRKLYDNPFGSSVTAIPSAKGGIAGIEMATPGGSKKRVFIPNPP